jgi:hypothetical protein
VTPEALARQVEALWCVVVLGQVGLGVVLVVVGAAVWGVFRERAEMSSVTTCNQCGAVIGWTRLGGRWVPVDPDGRLHFDTCEQRVRAQREQMRRWYARLEAGREA